MGWFTNSAEEEAEIRGVDDEDLPKLTDSQIIMLALARLFEGEGIADDLLVEEMRRRATISL